MTISPNAMQAAATAKPRRSEMRRLDGPEHRHRSVAGEEKIIAHGVGHEQRRETRVSPDHAGRRWQGAETLAELPHTRIE